MLLARALKIVNITKVFTTLVAISSIRPVSGSIKVQIYKAIVIGMNPKGFFYAFRISSSIVDFVLLATFSNAFNTTDIMKPLKRNAMRITINELMIEPKSIPKNPLFHTSVIKFIKFSIII